MDANIYLDKFNLVLNPNQKVVNSIREQLVRTKGHCPCVEAKTEDTLCPCKNLRETGKCCCTLYVKKG